MNEFQACSGRVSVLCHDFVDGRDLFRDDLTGISVSGYWFKLWECDEFLDHTGWSFSGGHGFSMPKVKRSFISSGLDNFPGGYFSGSNGSVFPNRSTPFPRW